MNYKVVFVNWTKPYFYKKDAEGYNFDKLAKLNSIEYDMVGYELLIQKAAIHNAKKFLRVPIKLYTDDIGYEFYVKHNMINLFDEIDIETLNEYNKNTNNAGKWWTSGKSVAMGKEESPFLFLDNDFIVQSELPEWVFNYDLVHTQWEIQRGHFYASEKMLNDYNVPITNFNEHMMMPNTSFVFMNNKKLQKLYYQNHLKIVLKDYKNIPEWLWLLSDQGILGYCSRELGVKVASLEDKAYLSYAEHPDLKSKCGYSPMYLSSDSIVSYGGFKYWHIWMDKRRMKNDTKFRTDIVSKLKNILNIENNQDLI